MNTAVERCPLCNGVLAIIGRVHLCRPSGIGLPSAVEVGIPASSITATPFDLDAAYKKFGVEVDKDGYPKRPRAPLSAQGAGPAQARAVPAKAPKAPEPPVSLAAEVVPKPRAKNGTGVYGSRDADARRAYMRSYMQKRRAKT